VVFSIIVFMFLFCICYPFLRATAATAVARLSHRNSVCRSVRPSVTRVDQSKMVQWSISSPSAAWKTLSFRNHKAFFINLKGVISNEGTK